MKTIHFNSKPQNILLDDDKDGHYIKETGIQQRKFTSYIVVLLDANAYLKKKYDFGDKVGDNACKF